MQRPRFRTDLVSKPVEENGQRFVDVTDPDSGKTFRFYEVEYAVACAMNGDRSIGDLTDWARAELGLEPSPNELETVISTLGDLGYLASNGANLDVDDLALGAPGRSPLDSGVPPRPRAEEFELGVAGKSPMGAPSKPQPAPSAPVELGAAGFAAPEPRPPFEVDSRPPEPLHPAAPPPSMGTPGKKNRLSTNLGEHLEIGADDVREAVRQSKVMEAVPMPADMMQEMDAPHHAAPPPGATPIELPGRQRPHEPAHSPQVAPPPPRPGTSSITIIMLVVLLLAAVGLAAYYFLVYAKGDDSEGTRRPRGAAADTTAQADTPGAITSKLAAGAVTETAVTAPRDGKLEWVEAAGAEVTEGAIVAKYDGFQKVWVELEADVKSRDRYKAKLEKATESDNKKAMAKHAADVERKEGDIAEVQDELEKYVVKAPAPGVITPLVEGGAAVKEGDELVKVAVATGPSATFELPGAEKREVGDTIQVAAKTDPSLTAACKISKISGPQVLVTCPTDIGIEEGAEIIVQLDR